MADQEVSRGDIWLMQWSPSRGHEQAGARPSLILQNDVGNRYSPTTIVAAITSVGRRQPVIVPVQGAESGLSRQSFVHLGQIRTVDKSRLLQRMGRTDPATMLEVDRALEVSLGLVGSAP